MILQRLISEAAKLPDLSESVVKATGLLSTVGDISRFSDIELLNKLVLQPHACENIHRQTINLKSIEASLLKAKHASFDKDGEDFV